MKKTKTPITSTGNKRLYQMGPIDAVKLISYPAPSTSMLEGKVCYGKKNKK
jgi:hypothetical protein